MNENLSFEPCPPLPSGQQWTSMSFQRLYLSLLCKGRKDKAKDGHCPLGCTNKKQDRCRWKEKDVHTPRACQSCRAFVSRHTYKVTRWAFMNSASNGPALYHATAFVLNQAEGDIILPYSPAVSGLWSGMRPPRSARWIIFIGLICPLSLCWTRTIETNSNKATIATKQQEQLQQTAK